MKKYERSALLELLTNLPWHAENIEAMPTIAALKLKFREELHDSYPRLEIDHFFAMVAQELLGYSGAEIQMNPDESVAELKAQSMDRILKGLLRSEPIQYLLGFSDFYGLRFKVNPHVLIPRPETEELVRWVLDESGDSVQSILDLGTGSGCIAISLKKAMPHVQVLGVDKSVEALNLAQQNAIVNDANMEFFGFDILKQESMGFMKFDIMVSNPPYVTYEDKEKMEPNVLDFEPHIALFVPEDDPLIFYRNIVDLAEGHLKKGGKIFFEINESFSPEIRSLLTDRGFTSVEIRKDLNGRYRMAKGIKT